MTAVLIGISSGVFIVLLLLLLKGMDKKCLYGLILSGIGFLYVGFVWADWQALLITGIQAVIFLFLAYYGVKGRGYMLAAGYFLHGCWDLAYRYFELPGVVPPDYDLFCMSLDFTVGAYLMFLFSFSARKTQIV